MSEQTFPAPKHVDILRDVFKKLGVPHHKVESLPDDGGSALCVCDRRGDVFFKFTEAGDFRTVYVGTV